jgi:hypothetical protein
VVAPIEGPPYERKLDGLSVSIVSPAHLRSLIK